MPSPLTRVQLTLLHEMSTGRVAVGTLGKNGRPKWKNCEASMPETTNNHYMPGDTSWKEKYRE